MKKRFVLVALVCLMCLTLFAACDLGERDQDSDVKIPQEEITTAGAIYDSLDITLDRDTMLNTEAEQLAKRAFGAGKEVLGYNIADGIISVVATVTDGSLGSVAAVISVQTQPYLDGDIKKMVLKDAGGYTIEQQIAESQSAQVAASITEAFEEIVGRIDRISEGNLRRVNYYPVEQTMQNGDQLCVFGPVRSDGSFVKLDVSENGEIVETVILVQGADEMQQEEVYDAYQNGADFVSGEPRPIDTDKLYTQPPTGQLQPDPDWGGSNPDDPTPGGDEETITIGEIFDQNFANIDFNDKLNDMFVDIVKIGYPDATSVDPMFYDENGNKTTVYYEMIRGGRTYFGGLTFPTPDGLPNGENLEAVILQQLGLNASTEVPVDETAKYVSLIDNAINSYDLSSVVGGLTVADLTNKMYGIATNNSLPAPSNDFGEALMQDMGASGTIIATYVGDMSGEILDSAHRFDTGYYADYDLVVVYQTEGGINITTAAIYNAWYTNSTNESLYANILNGTKDYQIASSTTTTIENPIDLYVMVNENDSRLWALCGKISIEKRLQICF